MQPDADNPDPTGPPERTRDYPPRERALDDQAKAGSRAAGEFVENPPGLGGFLHDGILPFLTLDLEGRVLSVNDSWVREMGYERDQVVGRPFTEFVSSEDRTRFRKTLRGAGEEGVFPDAEFHLILQGGGEINARFCVRVEHRQHGSHRVHCFFSNVTELREKEVEAREKKRRLDSLIANLPGVVYRCLNRPGYPMEFLGGQVEALTGFGPDEFLDGEDSLSWEELIVPDDRQLVWEEIQESVEAEEHFELEYRIQDRSGEIRWVWERGGAVAGDPGKPTVLEGFITDITPRKSVELDLQQRNVFIQTILDNLPIGLAVNFIDEGTAVYMNREFSRVYGWPEEELTDISRFFELVYPDPEYRAELMERVMADIASGDPDRMYWEGLDITGQGGRKAKITAKNIPIPEQNFMISTVWDVTDLTRAREELEKSVTVLRSLADHIQTVREEEKTSIAREIHDTVGQALTAALMDAASIREGVQDRPDLAERAAELSRLLKDTIADTQRLSADLRPNLLEVLGLGPAVQDLLDRTADRFGLSCHLEFNLQEGVLDQRRSLQVYRLVQESVTNVVRHAEASRVEVDVGVDQGLVRIRVEDNGIGISDEAIHHPRCWGLMGMRERLHALGGHFEIRGIPGTGTTVDMSFSLSPS